MADSEIHALRLELRAAIDQLRQALTDQVSRLVAEVAEVAKKQAVADALAESSAKRLCPAPGACLELEPRVETLEEAVADIRQERAVERAERQADRRALLRNVTVLAALGQFAAVAAGLALQWYSMHR